MFFIDSVLDKLIVLLGPIATLAKEKRELKDNAFFAISTALVATKNYYGNLARGGEKSADMENQLAKYWAAAAIPLRHIDESLAMTCEHKSDFWAGYGNWTKEEITRMGIKLEDVTDAYRKLAMPKSLSKARAG